MPRVRVRRKAKRCGSRSGTGGWEGHADSALGPNAKHRGAASIQQGDETLPDSRGAHRSPSDALREYLEQCLATCPCDLFHLEYEQRDLSGRAACAACFAEDMGPERWTNRSVSVTSRVGRALRCLGRLPRLRDALELFTGAGGTTLCVAAGLRARRGHLSAQQ